MNQNLSYLAALSNQTLTLVRDLFKVGQLNINSLWVEANASVMQQTTMFRAVTPQAAAIPQGQNVCRTAGKKQRSTVVTDLQLVAFCRLAVLCWLVFTTTIAGPRGIIHNGPDSEWQSFDRARKRQPQIIRVRCGTLYAVCNFDGDQHAKIAYLRENFRDGHWVMITPCMIDQKRRRSLT